MQETGLSSGVCTNRWTDSDNAQNIRETLFHILNNSFNEFCFPCVRNNMFGFKNGKVWTSAFEKFIAS